MIPDLTPQNLPQAVRSLCSRLKQHGHNAWLVGGCVRDSILAQWNGTAEPGHWVAKDWDLATDATPERVMQIFRRVIPTGIDHGTVTVMDGGLPLEVTTLRVDADYQDGRRPDSIHFVQSIEEDLARRDFTVNAIAFEPTDCEWIAPHGGLEDLKQRRLKAVGEPARRFAEDGLRVLRAARFVASLEFSLDEATEAAIAPSLDSYRQVSAERIRDEWNKALRARQPSRAFELMATHGMLEITAPELETGSLSLDKLLSAVDAAPAERCLRLATLMSALQPASAADLALRLRYSNAECKHVARLVEHQQLPVDLPKGAQLRRWLQHTGVDLSQDLFVLAQARSRASCHCADTPSNSLEEIEQFRLRVEAEMALDPPLSVKALAINGKTLMSRAGLKPGRQIGVILGKLLDFVVDDPARNTEEQLLERVRATLSQEEVG